MPRPVRRASSAFDAILSTIINVITLPFRVLGRLFGRSGRSGRAHHPR